MDKLLKLHYRIAKVTIKKWAKDPNRNLTNEEIQMANKHVRRCSNSYVHQKMQMKTSMRYYYTPMRTTKTRSASYTTVCEEVGRSTTWKQTHCPSLDEQLNKLVLPCNGIFVSVKNKCVIWP